MFLTRVHDRLLPTGLADLTDPTSTGPLRQRRERTTNKPSTPSPERSDSPPDSGTTNPTQNSGFAGPSPLAPPGSMGEVFMHEPDGDRAFPDGSGHAFDLAAAHVTDREDSWEAGLERERWAVQ